MCDHERPHEHASAPSGAALPLGGQRPVWQASEELAGSRRRRLWELPGHTHCPIIGVCLPIPVVRRLVAKALGGSPVANDYEYHIAAVSECGRRMPIAQALQRELDRRYAPTLKRFAQAKSTIELAKAWREALQGTGVAGALWATLSHARCGDELRELVTRDIHMFQHQVGACNRADLERLDALQEDHAALAQALSALKERHARMLAERGDEIAALNTALVRTRGRVIAGESQVAELRDELTSVKAGIPDLKTRLDLERRVELQRHRIHELERARLSWQQRAEQEQERARQLACQVEAVRNAPSPAAPAVADLRDKAVLCVGGRPASVPSYRVLIEDTGGRFLHHDGGEEHTAAQLDASLAAADLVICQTGCVSHGAYWRVKDHCKRTGKRCVFVDKPSSSSLARCLREIGEPADAVADEGSGQ